MVLNLNHRKKTLTGVLTKNKNDLNVNGVEN